MFDNDDIESQLVKSVFNSLSFEYTGMSSKPTGYNYLKCKDSIKWLGLKPKDYIPLIDRMFNTFVKNIPSSK